ENSYFQVSTVRPEKLNTEAKTNIVGAKYSWNTSKQTLVYSYSDKDTFDVKSATFGNDTELVEGVTDFSVKPYYGDGKKILPSLVVIRMELVDSKTLRRIQANTSAKEAILKNANKREFRRMVVIDRGQPKPKL
ncbi:MAG: hypothetical protein J6W70_06540, partial [Lentisphaeria bacterium]|nr:hypothetical protein [Lentisphaeria bacterium]